MHGRIDSSGLPAALHDYAHVSQDEMAAMLRGMHPNAVAAGRELALRFYFSRCRSMVDIAGGSGGLAATLCAMYPGLRGTLFELPQTAALAAPILANTPGGDRVSIETGDILLRVPSGSYDVIVVRAFIQVLGSADAARALLHAARAARSGGTIFILGGGILDNDRLGPRAAAFLNVTFLNLYPDGGSYTEAEYSAWLSAAGCVDFQRVRLPDGGSILRATKGQY